MFWNSSIPVKATARLRAAGCLAAGLLLAPQAIYALIGTNYQMQLGNPSAATADTNNHSHYLIERPVQTLDYNDTLGLPNWASWNLTASDLGTNSRSTFLVDTNLPPNFYRVGTGEYAGSGYDRGHLCPSADRDATASDNALVYFMSNVLPQHPRNNSGVWLQFEDYCRSLVTSTNHYELLIQCGPSGFTGARINTNGYVAIPSHTWKIVVVLPPGSAPATNRITATNRVIALKIPNDSSATNPWPYYVTAANQIQVDTGLTFFTALPPDVSAALRAKVDGQTNPQPAIFAFAPASGQFGTPVTLTGTNFTAVSAVAFNGASAAFAVDSATQITTTVPTNAGSGFLSVTTSAGTAISADAFTVLNNGGTVYSGTLAAWDVSTLPGGLNNYGPSPLAPTTSATNLVIVGLTRGSGVKTTGTAAAGGWGGVAFTSSTASNAVAANQFVSFTMTATAGYQFSCSSLNRFAYYRSPSGPTNGVLQCELGTSGFIDITNLSYPTVNAGAALGAIDLSHIAALQNVGANTNLTFRIVNFGGTSSAGTWYLYNSLGTTSPDLALQGTVTQVLATNPPALAPILVGANFTDHQFRFTLTGSAGTNYVVQAATNLASAPWISVTTNAAPFQFSDTNADSSPQRFFRARLAL